MNLHMTFFSLPHRFAGLLQQGIWPIPVTRRHGITLHIAFVRRQKQTKQESPVVAKVNARQQCVHEGPSEKIHTKSAIYEKGYRKNLTQKVKKILLSGNLGI